MKKIIMVLVALTLTIVLAACGDNEEENAKKDEQQSANKTEEQAQPQEQNVEVTEKEKVDEKTPVVSINGEEIKGETYNPLYMQIKMQMAQFGQDVSDVTAVKDQTLNMIVEQKLIRNDAKDKGLEVTDKEVQKEFDTIKEQNGDQLKKVLKQFKMSEEDFKNQLANDLVTQKYIDSEIDVKVTDKEIEEYYNKIKEQNKEIGKLKEVKEPIKSQLKKDKTSKKLQEKVKKLKEDAEVEKMI
ncbi:SurA N-terminal domain-containing protein [Virgibacillus halodenitrificans]|uniref:peptidylprolyl isomerase n=1 Tax=Virgibacillus halodenitrificans TaxID=1482 RepID=A0ABR7VRB7_VIRHA|nr:SurA N-terminal domain-containing protein [Virgibacillus halodenitrificans]MBD1223072.1 SurA N-terminal domain-containing protein [Virgibacillus halodenitrificans]MCG1027374.1 SurA N-terminal domain-containing protein [Virgibacillus halodenitrificans]MCJ0930330.1 SurA N-terminal domain-containing protein [Virgibacillus halodenitrificans]MEC2159124.1 SurA N-terminal domain-containing protein [Virgibacillus halodenitrificans]